MKFIIRENDVDIEVVEIAEVDKKIVEHFVGCFKSWICEGPVNFVKNKSLARRNALKNEAIQALINSSQSIPENEDEIFLAYFALPDYKTIRQQQEEKN